MDRYENCVVVDLVTVNSSAQGADVRKVCICIRRGQHYHVKFNNCQITIYNI